MESNIPKIHVTLQLVNDAFRGLSDKGGQPYIFHLTQVAGEFGDLAAQTVGLLHDIVEDTEFGLNDLVTMGYPDEIVDAVDALTKREGESYEDYLNRVKENPLAIRVKLVDLKHNMDLTRLPVITEIDERRNKKYFRATGVLQNWIK